MIGLRHEDLFGHKTVYCTYMWVALVGWKHGADFKIALQYISIQLKDYTGRILMPIHWFPSIIKVGPIATFI